MWFYVVLSGPTCGPIWSHLPQAIRTLDDVILDQLWIQRPSLALARYATPIPGLTLCGAASHPGGPFLGGAGSLAARCVLAS